MIERRRTEGVITAAYWAGHGDWPEFRMRTTDCLERTWARYGDVTRYVEGLKVRVEYVTLDNKPDSIFPPELGTTTDEVVAVWIESSDERNRDTGRSGLASYQG